MHNVSTAYEPLLEHSRLNNLLSAGAASPESPAQTTYLAAPAHSAPAPAPAAPAAPAASAAAAAPASGSGMTNAEALAELESRAASLGFGSVRSYEQVLSPSLSPSLSISLLPPRLSLSPSLPSSPC
jgi:hypothetical protein